MKKIIFLLIFFFLPSSAFAVADLQLRAQDIRFANDLVVGESARVYALIRNNGTEDMTGYVLFRVGGQNIGTSQVVTVVAGGVYEEVWVDFVVPDGEFNVYAELRGTDPEDEQPTNDYALSPLFIPTADEDGDGVEDSDDNCPENSNTNQLDTDGDSTGDICDDDDDNDGMSDDVEEELGTDPTDEDTDDDGVNDNQDAFPLNDQKTEVDVEVVPVQEEVTVEVVESKVESILDESPDDEQDEELTEDDEEVEFVVSSPNTNTPAFLFTRETWNTYAFDINGDQQDYSSIAWDFGDGVTSAKNAGVHQYKRAGEYLVTLTLINQERYETVQQKSITISAFHLGNPLIAVFVVLLCALLGASTAALWRVQRLTPPKKSPSKKRRASTAKKRKTSIPKKHRR